MTAENRDKVLNWYADKQEAVFDFKQEMLDYCRSDGDILRHACMRYRDLLIKATSDEGCPRGVDPFQHITIVSVALTIFRTKFLPESWSVKLST